MGLTVGKAVVGVMDNSVALIADAAHSLGDVVSGAVALWGVKLGSQPEDENHPYGKTKSEPHPLIPHSIFVLVCCGRSWQT
jgi:divalent metal cation (Fe/Co/Zn/Cd) transporter